MKIIITIIGVFTLILCSCNNQKAEYNTTTETKAVTEKVNESNDLKEIQTLFKHLETAIEFGKTTPIELRKHYDLGEDENHENYLLKGSNLDGSNETFYNFSFEEGKLVYITHKANDVNPTKVKDFIISKFGEGKVLSEEYKNRIDWETEKFNINFDTQNTPWSLNIEPKDYYPGF